MPSVLIRQSRVSDQAFVVGLSEKVFSTYGPYGETISEWLESGLVFCLVAVLEKQPAGFAMLGRLLSEEIGMYYCELLAVAVEPERQRMGIARLLLERIEIQATQICRNRLFLHTAAGNFPAQQLFLKGGYRPYGRKTQFYPGGQDALAMVKELALCR